MKWKGFLKPDWRKTILPILFIVFFSFLIYWFLSFFSIFDQYGCDLFKLLIESNEKRIQNDTLGLNSTLKKIGSLTKEMRDEIESSVIFYDYAEDISNLNKYFKRIDPIFPSPCTMRHDQNEYCKFYISRDTYECYIDLKNKLGIIPLGPLFETRKIRPYSQITSIDIILNIILLFAEGYIISCLIIWIYEKFKKKK